MPIHSVRRCKAFSVSSTPPNTLFRAAVDVPVGFSSDFALPEDNWDLESESSGLSSYSEEDAADDMYSKEMDTYMDAMDRELRTTNVQQTLVDGAIRKVRTSVKHGPESRSV